MRVDRDARPIRASEPAGLERPADLEDVAFWPITALAHLIRTRQVSSVELTEMYLARLERYNPKLNCVVTLTPDLAMREARKADAELREGTYRGPLHGIPWGAKDIIAVRGYPTTWGSNAFKDQVTEHEATVVTLLRDAGAVLVAKLTTGELASGDRWFGGRTRNPWDSEAGSSGSSAGPASATVAGCVGFAIGTETSGSILSPSIACGASGLRPTYGRVSRYGAMTLRWTGDRLGPICRYVEDCALVFHAIARPDERDPSVLDVPFNWDATRDARDLRMAYFEDAFAEDPRKGDDWKANDERALDQLRSMDLDLTAVSVPLRDFSTDALRPMSAESTAAFDDFLREGREAELGRPGRGSGWRVGRTIPAVEYLQAQRVRGLMMKEFSDALGDFDVWVAPYGDSRGYLRGETPPGGGGSSGGPPPRRSRHVTALSAGQSRHLPRRSRSPRMGRGRPAHGLHLHGEAVPGDGGANRGQAYQDATEFHLRQPTL